MSAVQVGSAAPQIAALFAVMIACAIVIGRARWRIALAFAIAAAALPVPWTLPEREVGLRAVIGLFSLFPTMRTIEVVRDRRDHSLAMRFAYFLTPLDLREIGRAPPALDGRLAARIALHAALAAGGAAILATTGPDALALRLLAVLLVLYGVLDAVASTMRWAARLAGIDVPELQRHPILADSVSDFWGRRWNRAVGGWLRRQVFSPLARRVGPASAIAGSFAVSAWIHFHPMWIAAGLGPAASFGGYFLVEGALAIVESRAGISRWPRVPRRIWTIVAVLAPSPLFLHPLLRVFGG